MEVAMVEAVLVSRYGHCTVLHVVQQWSFGISAGTNNGFCVLAMANYEPAAAVAVDCWLRGISRGAIAFSANPSHRSPPFLLRG